MLRTRLMPLRSTVGSAASFNAVSIIRKSSAVSQLPTLTHHHAVAEIEKIDYSDFLPSLREKSATSRTYHPISGSERAPAPRADDFPFGSHIVFAGLNVLLGTNPSIKSRDLWLDLEFTLSQTQTIGGICYMGLPQLPYRVTPQGENSANFGLPREIRVIWERSSGDFIDDELVTTQQEPASHSGVHLLCTQPLYTDRLVVRLGDWPKIITRLETVAQKDGCVTNLVERFGLVIPAIFPFLYEEKTRYRAHVPMGVLASVKSPGESLKQYLCTRRPAVDEARDEAVMTSSYLFRADTKDHRYFTLGDTSATGSDRLFRMGDRSMRERYVSVPLAHNESVRFYVEQSEGHDRCVAGIKIIFDTLKLDGIATRHKTNMRVYELDLVEGMSAVDLTVEPGGNKYATLLFDADVPGSRMSQTCRFRRPSLSHYFVIEFRSVSGKVSQVCIDDMTLVQSAAVTVSPRKSRAQVLQNMHYRLIGPNLANDYAKIGDAGFTLSVETNVAGQRTSLLFEANSLLDLVQSGSARVIANQRRLETVTDVSHEIAETQKGSFDETERRSRSHGWRRSETGDGITWPDRDKASQPDGEHGFESISSSEIRTQTEHIANEGLPGFLEAFEPIVQMMFPNYSTEQITAELPRLLAKDENGYDWQNDVWRGIKDVDFQDMLSQLSLPPWVHAPHSALVGIADVLQDIAAWLQNPLSFPTGPNMQAISQLITSTPLGLINGLGVGLSLGFQAGAGGSFSFSADRLLPSFGYTATLGRVGTIAKQANKAGYSYNQHLNNAFDISHGSNMYLGGRMIRTIKRELNQPGTVRKRKAGAEVMWQDSLTDIVVGKVPLNITLPATADNMYRTTDHSVTVRLGSNLSQALSVDVWFDVAEEIVREDY
jgi:hypothetical protein